MVCCMGEEGMIVEEWVDRILPLKSGVELEEGGKN